MYVDTQVAHCNAKFEMLCAIQKHIPPLQKKGL